MCGIVGYFGEKAPKQVLLSGLKKLEYRGYDSAGVAIRHNDQFDVYRAAGKLSALEEKVEATNFNGCIGIGHTRWATHGLPTENNAHPHKVKGVSLVQNGIIENYAELKKELIEGGAQFNSETDTEVVTHLIARELQDSPDLFSAIQKVIPQLRGAYAILVVSEKEPDTIVAFKAGPPLILGQGDGEVFLASDVQAFIEHTNKVVYLNDFEIVKVDKDQFQVFDQQGKPLQKKVQHVDISVATSDKKGFKHYMLKEMFEQPRAVANALNPYLNLETKEIDFSKLGLDGALSPQASMEALLKAERIYIVACGTSYYAGLYAKYLIEQMARIPVDVDVASEFRYREPVLDKKSVTLFISQSGETADTLAALRLAKEHGLPAISLCNTKRSTIDRESDLHLYMNSGVEVGVASTKAFLSTLAVLNTLSIYLAEAREKISSQERIQLVEALLSLPSLMEGVLSYDSFFNQASETLKNFKGFLYLGRGHNFPISMEGALK
jgi:glucosamine--fructose-6-phosphate aminotransferase (isomerizing)